MLQCSLMDAGASRGVAGLMLAHLGRTVNGQSFKELAYNRKYNKCEVLTPKKIEAMRVVCKVSSLAPLDSLGARLTYSAFAAWPRSPRHCRCCHPTWSDDARARCYCARGVHEAQLVPESSQLFQVPEERVHASRFPSPFAPKYDTESLQMSCFVVHRSVNEIICHGIPDARPLEDGDIINLDVSLYHCGCVALLPFSFFFQMMTLNCSQLPLRSQRDLSVSFSRPFRLGESALISPFAQTPSATTSRPRSSYSSRRRASVLTRRFGRASRGWSTASSARLLSG